MSDAESPVTRAEQLILGSILMSDGALNDVAEVLDGPEFASVRHEVIYGAIVSLAAEDKPHDPVAVAMRLDETRDLTRAGGALYLHELVSLVASPMSAEWYAREVKEAADRRRVKAIGARLEGISAADGSALEVLDAARAELDSLAQGRDDDVSISDSIEEALASLDAPPGIATPWPSVNGATGGWRKGTLTICAARPATGKSVVGCMAALDMARRGHTSLLFSLEMKRDDLLLRLMCNIGNVDGTRVLRRDLRPDDRRALAKAGDHIRDLPLIIDDRANLSVAQIRAKVRRTQRRADVGLVVVDYLGKLKPPSDAPRNDRRVQVDMIAWGLKETSMTLDVPVLALSQLNRGPASRTVDQDGWHNPTLADLRESGGIENDADYVWLLDRKDGDLGCDARYFIAKNRRGPQTMVDLVFQGHYSRLAEPGEPWGQGNAA